MADIPVRRRTGGGWVMALMIAVAIAVVIWVYTVRWQHASASASPPVTPPQVPNTLYNQRIVTVESIYKFPNAAQLVGMRAEIPSARVQRAVTGNVFYIGDPAKALFLVTPNTAEAKRQRVHVGENVAFEGTFERMPSAEKIQKRWHVDAVTAQELARQGSLYIEADEVFPAGPRGTVGMP